MISFGVGRSGQIVGASVARSSGSPALDAEALGAVRRASPVPPPPPEVGGSVISFAVPIHFH
ncbi:MAG: hypothetical protein NVSMB26_16780 [Beijerinckiaceae bacterium]